MTKLDLPRLLKETEGATPGPLFVSATSVMGLEYAELATVYNVDRVPTEDGLGSDIVRIAAHKPCYEVDGAEGLANAHLFAYAPAMRDELVRLTEERDRLVEALEGAVAIIRDTQAICINYLQPNGFGADEFIAQVIELHDCPHEREVLAKADAVLKQVRGE